MKYTAQFSNHGTSLLPIYLSLVLVASLLMIVDPVWGTDSLAREKSAALFSIVVSNNGKLVAAAGGDKCIRVWDVLSAKELCDLRGHREKISSLTFCGDSKTLASSSFDRSIRVWNLENGTQVRNLSDSCKITSICYSAESKTLASSNLDGKILGWDIETGEKRFTLSCSEEPVNAIEFGFDGTTIVSGSRDGRVSLWSIASKKELFRTTMKTPVRAVSISPDNKFIVIGTLSGNLKLLEAKSGKQIRDWYSPGLRAIYSIDFSPDGKYIAVGCHGPIVRILKISDFKNELSIDSKTNVVFSVVLRKNLLAIAGSDSNASVWDLLNHAETKMVVQKN